MLLNRIPQSLLSVFRQQLQFLPAHHMIAVPFSALTCTAFGSRALGAEKQSRSWGPRFQICCTEVLMGKDSKRQLINCSACIFI